MIAEIAILAELGLNLPNTSSGLRFSIVRKDCSDSDSYRGGILNMDMALVEKLRALA